MKKPDSIFELYTGTSVRNVDDIQSLKQHLPGGRFRYVDVSVEQQRDKAFKRWPLMTELYGSDQQPNITRSIAIWTEKPK